MGTADDIRSAVTSIARANWKIRDGQVVPSTQDVALANGAVRLDAVYLYADMADSTGLARDFTRETAAKVIRCYLDATCRVIKARSGVIRSFDGDRVMAIFVGNSKNSNAAQCALNINYAVQEIVRPIVERNLPSLARKGYRLSHCVGIASGEALVVRGGVRGTNDLISVGRAPNVAAKLSEIRNGKYRSYVTGDVFNKMRRNTKYGGNPERAMWTRESQEVGGRKITVHKSLWTWEL
ncbi:MAG: adenylate/guanylate cyclase domain-containing protein [bacterium]|nr:adenylate/guanylate cyclase domain-containing protein [bacterium]